MKNEKKQIIDLVNKIKYEVTEQQLAELSGSATPLGEMEFVDWHARIDNLNLDGGTDCSWFKGEMAAQLREVLHRIADKTCEIGGRVVRIGKRVLKWIFFQIECYPNTAVTLVVLAALTFLVAQIPLLKYVLLPIVEAVGIVIVGLVFLKENAAHRAVNADAIH